jgi:hypothetical protein
LLQRFSWISIEKYKISWLRSFRWYKQFNSLIIFRFCNQNHTM